VQAATGSININDYLKPASVIFFGLMSLLLPLAGIAVAALAGLTEFEKPGLINVASVIVFISITVLSLASNKIYFFFLPFVLLAFPTAVNDFFPAVYLGSRGEIGAAAFPFINHIDLFLVAGLVRLFWKKNTLSVHSTWLIAGVFLFFFLSSFINIVANAGDVHHVCLILAGGYPLRYLFMLLILLSNVDFRLYEKEIVTGFIVSVFFLFVEALLNTYMTGTHFLASGSLGANTFANIVSSLLVFFVYLRRLKYRFPPFIFWPLIVVSCLIIVLSETRIAIIAALLSFMLIQLYYYSFIRSFIVVCVVAIAGIIFVATVDLPKRYSLKHISSKIHFNFKADSPLDMVTVERSEETNSIYSRLKLYKTSARIIADNPVFGTGYGTFNYVKNDYGFNENTLIDAHNGYLNTISQLGLTGIFFLYFIYFFPFFAFNKILEPTVIKYFFIINITMSIADISNAGIYKYSIFATLAFGAIMLSILKKYSHNGSRTQ